MSDDWFKRRIAEGMDPDRLIRPRTAQQEDEDARGYERNDPMAIGAGVLPGQTGITVPGKNPLCRDMCTSKDRPSTDSPAKFGTERGTGRKVLYCPCCQRELIWEERLTEAERRVSFENTRPPALNPALTAKSRRFVDPICQYDVHVLAEIKEVT